MAIQTPDQRVRVFVSSALQELAEERRAVREAIENLRLTPVMFEQGARPHPPRTLYRAYLEQSDVFIGLYWERYGWLAPGEEVSGLEDEYGLAGDRPKLIYLKAPAPNREPRLNELIARIRGDDRVSYRPFTDVDELRALVADDLAVLLTERFAASATEAAAPAQLTGLHPLPRAPTRLIGRDADIARVAELLSDPDARLVTISGAGGIGKTRLALAVAERTKDRYAGSVAYVDLAAVNEPSLLIPSIARALGIQEGPGLNVAAQLRERLTDAQMLIVLDGMEQLAEAAADVSELMAGAAALQILVTSRRILDIRGEQVFELEPLAVSTGGGTATAPAVELFLERARAIHPDYQPTDEDLAAIAEICRRLDGLPLAIELASARLRILAPSAMLERMGHHRLAFLRDGARDLPSRQRTLRDTVAWSHSLLARDSQRLFARLAVFVGSADITAIEGVANSDESLDTLDLLDDLVDQSLVRAVREAAEPRFGMLETIREYAAERLEASGDAPACRARHEAYYLELAQRGNAALSSAQQVEWLGRLGREIDNFRAVLRRALRREDAAAGLRMARALATYWFMHSTHTEARDWMDHIAALPSASPQERAAAWTLGAIQSFLNGDFELLEEGLDDAVRLARDPDDRRTVAFAQLLRAIARGAASDDAGWRAALTEASERLEAAGEPLAIGFGLIASSVVARIRGRFDEAQQLAQAAHDLSVRIGESYMRMYASGQLSRAALGLGDTAAARQHAIEALRTARRVSNLYAACYALELWAAADLRDGRIEHAGRIYALSERGYQQLGSGPWPTDADLRHELATALGAALGSQYGNFEQEARQGDFDAALSALTTVQPSGN